MRDCLLLPPSGHLKLHLIQMPICSTQIGRGWSQLPGWLACLGILCTYSTKVCESICMRVCACTRKFPCTRALSAWCIYNWRAGSVQRCGVVSHCLGCPGAPGTPVGIKVALIKCGPRCTALHITGPTKSSCSAVFPMPLRFWCSH